MADQNDLSTAGNILSQGGSAAGQAISGTSQFTANGMSNFHGHQQAEADLLIAGSGGLGLLKAGQRVQQRSAKLNELADAADKAKYDKLTLANADGTARSRAIYDKAVTAAKKADNKTKWPGYVEDVFKKFKLRAAGRILRIGGSLLAVGLAGLDIYETRQEYANKPGGTTKGTLVGIKNNAGIITGGFTGGWAGAALGATIGTIVPVVGTTIGGIVGGLIGAAAGSVALQSVVDWAVGKDGFTSLNNYFAENSSSGAATASNTVDPALVQKASYTPAATQQTSTKPEQTSDSQDATATDDQKTAATAAGVGHAAPPVPATAAAEPVPSQAQIDAARAAGANQYKPPIPGPAAAQTAETKPDTANSDTAKPAEPQYYTSRFTHPRPDFNALLLHPATAKTMPQTASTPQTAGYDGACTTQFHLGRFGVPIGCVSSDQANAHRAPDTTHSSDATRPAQSASTSSSGAQQPTTQQPVTQASPAGSSAPTDLRQAATPVTPSAPAPASPSQQSIYVTAFDVAAAGRATGADGGSPLPAFTTVATAAQGSSAATPDIKSESLPPPPPSTNNRGGTRGIVSTDELNRYEAAYDAMKDANPTEATRANLRNLPLAADAQSRLDQWHTGEEAKINIGASSPQAHGPNQQPNSRPNAPLTSVVGRP